MRLLETTQMGNPVINIAIFAAFVVVTMFVVIRVTRGGKKKAGDFYTGGAQFDGRQNGFAIAGDYLSAASFLGIVGAIATAVPGVSTFQQLDEDLAVARDLDYTAEERKFLQDRDVRLSLGACVQCGACSAACPAGVDVPALMRTHLYISRYANFGQARSTLDAIPRGSGPSACRSCGACSAACPKRVPAAERVGELKTLLG